MKYALILLLSVACNKSDNEPNEKCYTCEISAFNGQPGYKQDICTNQIDTVSFKTALGQPLGFACEPK